MPIKVERWKCDYCNIVRAKKSAITIHEKLCHYNPDTRSCATCENHTPILNGSVCIGDKCTVTNEKIFVKGKSIYNCPHHTSMYGIELEEEGGQANENTLDI